MWVEEEKPKVTAGSKAWNYIVTGLMFGVPTYAAAVKLHGDNPGSVSAIVEGLSAGLIAIGNLMRQKPGSGPE